jgi:hypothetical protein
MLICLCDEINYTSDNNDNDIDGDHHRYDCYKFLLFVKLLLITCMYKYDNNLLRFPKERI